MEDAALAYGAQVIGPYDVVKDHSWKHQWSSVVQLRDRAGHEWFLKQHRDRDRYLAEVTAYQRWVPALPEPPPPPRGAPPPAARAPMLPPHAAPHRAIALPPLPARPAPGPTATIEPAHVRTEIATQRQAGALLRRLHSAHSESQPE